MPEREHCRTTPGEGLVDEMSAEMFLERVLWIRGGGFGALEGVLGESSVCIGFSWTGSWWERLGPRALRGERGRAADVDEPEKGWAVVPVGAGGAESQEAGGGLQPGVGLLGQGGLDRRRKSCGAFPAGRHIS